MPLTNVHLKNLALIKEADIDYENGLNIMTGETGSGKSIIISSVNIALGEKANKSLIRSGCDHGLIELAFNADDENVLKALDSLGVERDGNSIIITRKISQDSSISKINGETVKLADVKKITSMLVDIHGQHDHQSLLDPANHITILDQFGAENIAGSRSEFKHIYDEYRTLRSEYRNFNMDDAELENKISYLEFVHNEIEEAALIPGEDEKLKAELKQLEIWEKESDSLKNALSALNSDDNGVLSLMSRVSAELSNAHAFEPENADISAFRGTASDVDSVIRDLSHDLEKHIRSHEFDRERYHTVRERLDLINRLKSKYGSSVDEIVAYDKNVQEDLSRYRDYQKNRENITGRLAKLRSDLNAAAGRLSEKRKESAKRLEKSISDNLSDLNFLNVDFRIDIQKNDKIHPDGFDRVEFLISLNPGETVKPLARIASGGELSRIMLAIKSSIAEKDSIPTLIFDEIDTGISGRTAQMVAAKLKELSRSHQIICITHLPQIAAMADTHFSIHKEAVDGTTISGIEKLDKEQELTEIARLLSGEHITEAAMENARELKTNG